MNFKTLLTNVLVGSASGFFVSFCVDRTRMKNYEIRSEILDSKIVPDKYPATITSKIINNVILSDNDYVILMQRNPRKIIASLNSGHKTNYDWLNHVEVEKLSDNDYKQILDVIPEKCCRRIYYIPDDGNKSSILKQKCPLNFN